MKSRLALLLAFVMTSNLTAQDSRPTTLAGRSTVYAPRGAIATSQPLATAAGLAVLQRGGNAFDAAVTAAAVLNVVEPHMTGIGGDLFALFWSQREQRLRGLDASGRAGALMTRQELLRRGHDRMPSSGAEAITVPGALSGWTVLLQKYGTITLADALAPAIRIAEEGFPVTPIIAGQWAAEVNKLSRDAGARATYLLDGRRAPRAGEWFRNPDLAATFRLIAESGPGVFYGGVALDNRIVWHRPIVPNVGHSRISRQAELGNEPSPDPIEPRIVIESGAHQVVQPIRPNRRPVSMNLHDEVTRTRLEPRLKNCWRRHVPDGMLGIHEGCVKILRLPRTIAGTANHHRSQGRKNPLVHM